MKWTSGLVLLCVIGTCASCAQPMKPEPMEKAAASGSGFDAVGNVTLHKGQPCTPQIMFDFRRPKSKTVVWLGAPMRGSSILTDAANHHNRVYVTGRWHRGKQSGCSYVEVNTVAVAK